VTDPGNPVFTVGHGARSIDEFLEVLLDAGIGLLVDVRRYPGSKRHPHFGRGALGDALARSGVAYEWWGESMGGRREPDEQSEVRHGTWEIEAFRAYASHMDRPEFREALKRLMQVSQERKAAVMCSETLWWRCHRRLIADAVVAAGGGVVHLGMGRPQPHRLTGFARVDENGLLAYDGNISAAPLQRKASAMATQTPPDEGPNPFVINIEEATLANDNYRSTLWTGKNLQMTVMSIEPDHDIGLEVHEDGDQFLRVEAGKARVQMGPAKDDLPFDREVEDDWAILVPAGMWHNVTNIGADDMKVYALYAPPEHPHGTVHATKAESDAAEH
jgi:mannose-6-phosphate isomerase-like protein (cupin superfamily)